MSLLFILLVYVSILKIIIIINRFWEKIAFYLLIYTFFISDLSFFNLARGYEVFFTPEVKLEIVKRPNRPENRESYGHFTREVKLQNAVKLRVSRGSRAQAFLHSRG